MEADFRGVLGDRVFGQDGDDLATVVGRLLTSQRRTLALAESCSGGLVSTLLTDVPGSSEYFLGSVVSYANEAKERLLGVSSETLRAHGAVSAPSAAEMARGARERFDADIAVAITGIAGPDGGTPEKPVGTVFFAIASRDGSVLGKKRLLLGDRAVVRRTSALHALEMLRRLLAGAPEAA
jgi:nicotinamide-nucleotide amidase